MSHDVEVIDISMHRNGNAAPFYAIRFRFQPGDVFREEEFLATVFKAPFYVAVVCLDRIPTLGVVAGQGNSWDGDIFEVFLRELIELHRKGKKLAGQKITFTRD